MPRNQPCIISKQTVSNRTPLTVNYLFLTVWTGSFRRIDRLEVGCRHGGGVQFWISTLDQPGERHPVDLPSSGAPLDVSSRVSGWRGMFITASLDGKRWGGRGGGRIFEGRGGADFTLRMWLVPRGKVDVGVGLRVPRPTPLGSVADASPPQASSSTKTSLAAVERAVSEAIAGIRNGAWDCVAPLAAACRKGGASLACEAGGAQAVARLMIKFQEGSKGGEHQERQEGKGRGGCETLCSMAAVNGVVGPPSNGVPPSSRDGDYHPLARSLDTGGGQAVIDAVLSAVESEGEGGWACDFIAALGAISGAAGGDKDELEREGRGGGGGGGGGKGNGERDGESWRAILKNGRCIKGVLKAMKAWEEDAVVQRRGCNALWVLWRTAARGGVEPREVAEAILRGMCMHPGDEVVGGKGGWALWEVCGGEKGGGGRMKGACVGLQGAICALRTVVRGLWIETGGEGGNARGGGGEIGSDGADGKGNASGEGNFEDQRADEGDEKIKDEDVSDGHAREETKDDGVEKSEDEDAMSPVYLPLSLAPMCMLAARQYLEHSASNASSKNGSDVMVRDAVHMCITAMKSAFENARVQEEGCALIAAFIGVSGEKGNTNQADLRVPDGEEAMGLRMALEASKRHSESEEVLVQVLCGTNMHPFHYDTVRYKHASILVLTAKKDGNDTKSDAKCFCRHMPCSTWLSNTAPITSRQNVDPSASSRRLETLY